MEPKKNIMIVDDDSFLLDMYAMRFSQAQFVVTTATSAKDALEKLRTGFIPDVLLLDVVMPTIDGFELLETINQEHLALSTIKIYLSNLGQAQDIEKGTALGAASYIVKANSTPSEVLAHVNEVIQRHES